MHYVNLGLIFISGLNLGLATLIHLLNPKNKINRTLSLAVLFLATWTLGIAMFRQSSTESSAWFWTYVQNMSGALIVIPFYLFSIYFPYQTKTIDKKNKLLIFLSIIIVFFIVIIPGVWIKKIYLIQSSNYYDLNLLGVLYFNFHFLVYLILAFYTLIKKYFESLGFVKRQIFVTLVATSIIALFGSFFSAIIPLVFLQLGPYWLGPYFSLPMLIILVKFVFSNK